MRWVPFPHGSRPATWRRRRQEAEGRRKKAVGRNQEAGGGGQDAGGSRQRTGGMGAVGRRHGGRIEQLTHTNPRTSQAWANRSQLSQQNNKTGYCTQFNQNMREQFKFKDFRGQVYAFQARYLRTSYTFQATAKTLLYQSHLMICSELNPRIISTCSVSANSNEKILNCGALCKIRAWACRG